MSRLNSAAETMSDAKRQLLEKRLRGRIAEQGPAPRVFTLVENSAAEFSAYPLRKYQQAVLRNSRSVNRAAWFYLETEKDHIEASCFAEIFRELVAFHPILRTRLQSCSGKDQLITEENGVWTPIIKDLREYSPEVADAIQSEIRKGFSCEIFSLDSVQAISLTICILKEDRIRIHLGVNMLLLDLVSIEFLALQCRQLYEQRKTLAQIAKLSFRNYAITENEFLATSFEADKSRRYWQERLPRLHPLVTYRDLAISSAELSRNDAGYSLRVLEKNLWLNLKHYANQRKLTGSMLVYSLFSLLIAKWIGKDRFSLELRLFRRFPFHAAVNDIMGQFSSGIVSSLNIEREQSLHSYCVAIEAQTWRDLDHGYIDIASENLLSKEPECIQPGIVFTSTISRYQEFVEEGAIPPMKWFGKTINCAMHIPNQLLELLIVENDGELELHWFFNGACNSGNMIGNLQSGLHQSLTAAAQDPQSWFAISTGDAVESMGVSQ